MYTCVVNFMYVCVCVCVCVCVHQVIKRIPLEGMRMEMLNDPDMRHGFQIISTCKSFRLEARYCTCACIYPLNLQ